jgi:hypothetical protein
MNVPSVNCRAMRTIGLLLVPVQETRVARGSGSHLMYIRRSGGS